MSHLDFLSAPVAERARVLGSGQADGGRYVVYWMRTAVRGHDNPALDAAIEVARHLNLPVFVYHALSERYQYASDRHHSFILDSVEDVRAELTARGVGYAFHLEREGARGPWLQQLARDAAWIVTEDMPVRPLMGWAESLATRSGRPVLLVDTACLVPMRGVAKAYERAFAYRDATKDRRRAALRETWADVGIDSEPWLPELPFEPLTVSADLADRSDLLGACDIDHTVALVPHTRGGSTAGYERWEAFVANGIRSYDRTRNDPLRDGTSRMSAYLHYGHVSPFRLARESFEMGGRGPEKYLDELLVWREVAYAFCFHRPDHESFGALPGWAQQTLREHAHDERGELSWEQLSRAMTGDPLWDAAQRSLLIHGELHNNVRMTWGKAFLGWANPERALALAIDLNHRYALDGRDPASYGGLLWCFGQFDRPFSEDEPIYGRVRTRHTDQHAQRLDVKRYAQITARPLAQPTPRVAVVGAGLSGLTCARALADHGLDVTVIDKSRGTGGRCATRRTDGGGFDHGAQYFTARGERARRHVASWRRDGVVAAWDGRAVELDAGRVTPEAEPRERWVAVPGMSALGRHLATGLELRRQWRAVDLRSSGSGWMLHAETGEELGAFDIVVVSAPAPQTEELLRAAAPELAARAAEAEIAPCLAVMARFDEPLAIDFDGAFVRNSPLSWVARDSSKPGRAEGERWMLHAGPEWSEQHLESDPETSRDQLLAAFVEAVGQELPAPAEVGFHRWRYALPTHPLPEKSLFDASLGLGACGDWCGGPRVEGALESGAHLAGRILTQVGARPAVQQGALF